MRAIWRGGSTRAGMQARVAVAGTVGCAWARGAIWRSTDVRVASGDERDTLSPLPLAALRLPSDTLEALSQVGLKRIADVLDRPRAPLAARFGADFVRRLDQALGIEDEPITPRLPLPVALTEQRFPEPIAHERDVLGTIERLAARLGHVLEQRGEGARLLQAALFRADGKVLRVEAGTAAPLRDPGAHRPPVRGSSRCDRRRMRSGFRLRHGAALRAGDRAQRSAADRPRAARPCGGSRASDRPARRALRPAPRHAARAAGHAYPGIRRDGGRRLFLPHRPARRGIQGRRVPARGHEDFSDKTRPPPPARSACSRGRSRSRRSPKCRTDRRRSSPGGACVTP